MKWRTGYQFVMLSNAFTADYTKPGIYTAANATLNENVGYNTSITQIFDPKTGYNDARTTYLHLDKLVITNSDFPPLLPSPVPLPASLPLLGTALAALGLTGFRRRRRARAA